MVAQKADSATARGRTKVGMADKSQCEARRAVGLRASLEMTVAERASVPAYGV